MADTCCTKEKEIEKMLHAIYGNGEPGIKESLALIRYKLDSMPSSFALKAYMVVGSGLGVVGLYGLKILIG